MPLNPSFAIIIATIIWGSSWVFIKTIALPGTILAAFRLGVPAFSLLIYFWFKKIALWRNFSRLLIAASLLNALRLYIMFKGVEHTSITLSVIFSYTSPAFVMLFAYFILKEKITVRKVLILLTVLAGIIVLYSGQNVESARNDLIGSSLILLSSVIYALSAVLLKKGSEKLDHLQILFYQNILGALIFLPFLAIAAPTLTLHLTGLSFTYGLVIGLIGFIFFFYGFKRMSATTSSLLTYFEVVTGILFGMIFFNEVLTTRIVIGAILIVAPLLFVHEDRRFPFFRKKSIQK